MEYETIWHILSLDVEVNLKLMDMRGFKRMDIRAGSGEGLYCVGTLHVLVWRVFVIFSFFFQRAEIYQYLPTSDLCCFFFFFLLFFLGILMRFIYANNNEIQGSEVSKNLNIMKNQFGIVRNCIIMFENFQWMDKILWNC